MDLSPSINHRLPLLYLVLFCVIVGVISSLWKYTYFRDNSVDYIPQILRIINPGYLSNDFYLNVTSGIASPRYYFNELLAWLTFFIPLSRAFLGLTILAHILIALVTALFTRDLFDGSDGAALVSALAVMSVNTFLLSFYDNFFYGPIEPSLLIMPLFLACIWAALRQRPLLSALVGGLATLIHPLMGPEIGGIMLGTLGIEQIAHYYHPSRFPRKVNLLALLAGGAILAAFVIVVIVPILGVAHIPTAEFIKIYAYLRAPHHLVPSTWDINQYIQAVVYLVAAGIIWRLCYSISARLREMTPALLIICAILLALCLGSYVFVELIPTRLWVNIQGFRLLIIVKWLGICLTGSWIGKKIEKTLPYIFSKEDSLEPSGVSIITLLSSLLSPWNLLLVSAYELLKKRMKNVWLHSLPACLVVLASSLAIAVINFQTTQEYFLVPFFSIMALAFFYLRPRWLGAALISFLAVALLAPSLWPGKFPHTRNGSIMPKPATSLNNKKGDMADLSNFAQKNTPANAIFLVDPKYSIFRLTAQRALVVDFKDFPFSDKAMLEWKQRLFDCYGIPKTNGFNAMNEMSRFYKKITDDKLKALQIKYGVSYAVLHHETKTQFPVIFHTKDYKIVQIK